MAVLGLLLVLVVAALVVGLVYDNATTSVLHVFGVSINTNVISVFILGAAAMLVLLLGLWLLTASGRRARRARKERKAMEREHKAREAELEQEKARLAEERDRLAADRGHAPAGDAVGEDRNVDLRGRHAGRAVRSDTVYDPAVDDGAGLPPVRPADDPTRRGR